MSEALAKHLTELRKNKGLSRQAIADELEMSVNTYQKYEFDQSEPKLETLEKLATYFGVTTDYLLGREPKEEPKLDREKLRKEVKSLIDTINSLPEEHQAIIIKFIDDCSESMSGQKKLLKEIENQCEKKPPSLSQSQTTGAIEDDTAEETAG